MKTSLLNKTLLGNEKTGQGLGENICKSDS